MSSLYSNLTDKLYDYLIPLATGAGITEIIFDYSDGVRLEKDFMAVDVKSIISDQNQEVVYKQIGGGVLNEEIVNFRGTVDLAIDIYSNNGALFIAEMIKAGIAREKSHENAMKLNLGFLRYGDTINLSQIEKASFKHRGQFSLQMNYAIEYRIEDTTIGTSNIKGYDTEENLIIDLTVTEP